MIRGDMKFVSGGSGVISAFVRWCAEGRVVFALSRWAWSRYRGRRGRIERVFVARDDFNKERQGSRHRDIRPSLTFAGGRVAMKFALRCSRATFVISNQSAS